MGEGEKTSKLGKWTFGLTIVEVVVMAALTGLIASATINLGNIEASRQTAELRIQDVGYVGEPAFVAAASAAKGLLVATLGSKHPEGFHYRLYVINQGQHDTSIQDVNLSITVEPDDGGDVQTWTFGSLVARISSLTGEADDLVIRSGESRWIGVRVPNRTIEGDARPGSQWTLSMSRFHLQPVLGSDSDHELNHLKRLTLRQD